MGKEAPARLCTRQALEDGFRAAGVATGMVLVVHSSLKKIGWIPGGARSVVDALLTVLGPAGTLVMPAHTGENSDPAYWVNPPVPEDWWPVIRQTMPAYDPDRSPPRGMGTVVDCFRNYPGVRRSNHPACSFIALGPAAERILARHDMDSSLGERSPCGALYREDACVLLLGVDFDNCTVMHLAEDRTRCRMRLKQSSAIMQEGQIVFKDYLDLDGNSDDFLPAGREMEAAGLVRQVQINDAELRFFAARDAVKAAESWFARNRLHRLGEDDRARLIDFARHEPEYNLFLIGDVENFGMNADFLDIMAYEPEGAIDSVLLRYHRSFIPYSRHADFAVQPLLSALQMPSVQVISGKKDVLDRLRPHLQGFDWRDSYLMKLGRGELLKTDCRPEPAGVRLKPATVADIPAIVDLLDGISEFAGTRAGTREERIRQLAGPLEHNAGHCYFYDYNGQAVAVACTTAENSMSAMVVSVASHPDWRGRGLASRLVSELARILLADRLQYLCLFYNNPEAGRIYRRLGFKDAGMWVMATRQANLTQQKSTQEA